MFFSSIRSRKLNVRCIEIIMIEKQQLEYPIKLWSLVLILTLTNFYIGTQASAQSLDYIKETQLSQSGGNSTPSVSAAELFHRAYENRYTWDRQFPGYMAAVEVKQGKENYKGRVRVNPDLSVEVIGIQDKDVRQLVENQLGMIAVHRRRVPFEAAHKSGTFQMGGTSETGTVEIIKQGGEPARYKIADNQIKQVNRILGPHAVTVDTLDTKVTPEGYLATRYRTLFRQPSSEQVLFEQESEDTYEKVGNYYVLSRQVINNIEKGQRTNAELNFTDFQLLSPKAAKDS